MKIKNKIYQFIVSIVLVVSLLAGAIVPAYAKEFLEELHKLNIKMAVATSSDRELFMKTLEREGILKYFQKIVTVDEVERGKGYPDIYEEAARRIKVNPHKCLVFEDILV